MNTDHDMLLRAIPIGISVIALVISGLSLGWNMYRDLALKARLRVKFGVQTMHHTTFAQPLITLVLEVTNLGPGKIEIGMIKIKTAPLWRRLTGTVKRMSLLSDYPNPLSARLPAGLEFGKVIDILIPYNKDCFLRETTTHIGIRDAFGRVHWSRRRDIRAARKIYKQDFGRG